MRVESIVLSNDLQELERLAGFIQGLSETLAIDAKSLFQINLVCDELVTNIILYGYPTGEKGMHTIRLDAGQTPEGWELRLTDRGIPFNPLVKGRLAPINRLKNAVLAGLVSILSSGHGWTVL